MFKNRYLERILDLTKEGGISGIKWRRTETIAKNCTRWIGIGIKQKFVMVQYNKDIDCKMEDYVGYINKFITEAETSWEFVFDRFGEIENFICTMKNIIEPDEKDHKSGIYSVGTNETNKYKSLCMLQQSILNDEEYDNSEVWEYMKERDLGLHKEINYAG